MLKKVHALSSFYMQSMLKQKASYIFVILTLVILVLSWLSSDLNIGKKYKLFEDLMLTSQMFLLHLAAIFYAFEMLQKERLSGSFVLPLSTHISRRTYLFASFLAMTKLLLLLMSIFMLIDAVVLFIVESEIVWLVLFQLFLYTLSAILVVYLILMFAQYVSIMNALIYALTLFVIGGALDELYRYVFYLHPDESLQPLVTVLYYAVTNFSLFDIQSFVVNRSVFETRILIEPVIYFFIMATLVFYVATIKFEKRVLKVGE